MISYIVKVNGKIIHNSSENNILLDAKCSLIKNDVSVFNFATLTLVANYRDIVEIYKNGKQVFVGRVVNIQKNMDTTGQMYYAFVVEELLSIMKDVVSWLVSSDGTIYDAVNNIIIEYNRRGTMPIILENVESTQNIVTTTDDTKGLSTYDALIKLLEQVPNLTYQGRYENGKLYLSLLKQKDKPNAFVFHKEINEVRELLDGTQFVNGVLAISEWTWIEYHYEYVCRWEEF